MGRTDQSAESEQKAVVDAFETSLLTPIVSGDLTDWLEALCNAWRAVGARLDDEYFRERTRLYDSIATQDPELLPRVEQLRSEDVAIAQECALFRRTMERLGGNASKLEPVEDPAQQFTQKVIDQGLALVTRVRRQNIAVQTWYNEAFNRDRGTVD